MPFMIVILLICQDFCYSFYNAKLKILIQTVSLIFLIWFYNKNEKNNRMIYLDNGNCNIE